MFQDFQEARGAVVYRRGTSSVQAADGKLHEVVRGHGDVPHTHSVGPVVRMTGQTHVTFCSTQLPVPTLCTGETHATDSIPLHDNTHD